LPLDFAAIVWSCGGHQRQHDAGNNLSSNPLSVLQTALFFYDLELKTTEGPVLGDFTHENPQLHAIHLEGRDMP